MEFKNKKDIYSVAFSQGYQYGEFLNKGMISTILINRIVSRQKSIYKAAFIFGVEQKILLLEKEKRQVHPSLNSAKKIIDKELKDIDSPEKEI